jgi:hypothetical protein
MLHNQIFKVFISICLLLASCVVTTHAIAQSSELTNGSIGVLKYSVRPPSGWVSSSRAESKAQDLLVNDGVSMSPVLAFESSDTGIVYATWKVFNGGVVFSVEDLTAPRFPSAWKIDEKSVQSMVENVKWDENFRLKYSSFRAVGAGDGFAFGSTRGIPTFGYWIDMPLAYADGNGVHSVLLSLYYRGAVSNRNEEGINFIKLLVNSLRLQSGIRPLLLSEYNELFNTTQLGAAAKAGAAASGAKPDLMDALKEAQSQKRTGSNIAPTENSNAQNTNGVFPIKASNFCYEGGEIKLPPCAITYRSYAPFPAARPIVLPLPVNKNNSR